MGTATTDRSCATPARVGGNGPTAPVDADSRTAFTGAVPGLAAICAAVTAAGLPFVARPLSPDEGGFLLVASQWRAGTSLYGNYWVDRPPLLIGVFDLARHLGDAVALRLLGICFTVAAVLLAGILGLIATARPRRRDVLFPAGIAAVFLTTPLFGATEVNGERLAVPFVLAGFVALLLSVREQEPRSRLMLAGAAGVLAMCAALVKQNVVDVFVFAAVIAAHQVVNRRFGVLARTAAFGGGASLALVAAVLWAWSRGTSPTGLWDAVVSFRFQAAAVISSSAASTTPARLHGLLFSCVLSGAPLVVAAAVGGVRGRAGRASRDRAADPIDLRWAAVAVLVWESAAVLVGGSYWLHYLIGLAPGIVVLCIAAGQRVPGPWTTTLRLAAAYAVVATVVGLTSMGFHPPTDHNAAVVRYLRDHSARADSVVVGFGDPAIVQRSGMSSPYPQLWSLPVRVKDSHLTQLARVLRSAGRPTWVVVSGASLTTWGVQTGTAQTELEQRYTDVKTIGDLHVFRVDPSNQRGSHVTE